MFLLLLLSLLISFSSGETPSRAYCAAQSFTAAGKAHEVAMSLAMKGSYADSLWGFRRACSLEPLNPMWWNDLGVTLLRMQRPGSAEASFLLALRLDPGHESAAQNLAETREHLQRSHGSSPVSVQSFSVAASGGVAAAAAVAVSQGSTQAQLSKAALALDASEAGVAAGGESCSALLAPRRRLTPPLNATAYARFIKATGLRHSVTRLPRIALADIDLPANAQYRAGRAAYILTGTVPPNHPALARAGSLAALAAGPLASDTADFYPESMVEHTVHPFLLPFSTALAELASPSSAYPLPTSPRGGRYLHLNMGTTAWQGYLAQLAPYAVPAHLDTAEAWLGAGGLGEPSATDFAIGNHWRMLLIGSEGAGMFSHQDILKTASYQLQVAGYKTWHICAPSQSPHLHVAMDMFAPDYAAFPAALGASCYLDVSGPGDLLYYPADYWHQTLNTPAEAGGLSVAITDTLVDANNHALVAAGLADKCRNPTPYNRGGMIQEVCDKLPALVRQWEDLFGEQE